MNRLHSTKSGIRGKRLILVAGSGMVFIGLAAVALGCGWRTDVESSVRFRSYWDDTSDLRLLPPMTKSFVIDKRCALQEEGYEEAEGYTENVKAFEKKLWEDAEEASSLGDLATARKLLRRYLDSTEHTRETVRAHGPFNSYYDSIEIEGRQERRNSAQDRLDAMLALDRGSAPEAVRQYLIARDAYDSEVSEGKIEPALHVTRALDAVPADKNLADNVAYLLAALGYRLAEHEGAVKSFELLARRYPGSEKRDAALYMAALARLKLSACYGPPYGWTVDGKEFIGPRKDEAWDAARSGFLRVMREYPRGRYFNDARGWLAYLYYRVGDWPDAMVEYYRLLGEAEDSRARMDATLSLYLVRRRATEGDMREVELRLMNEPAAALAYAYHEMYNYSIGLCDGPDASEEERSKEAVGHSTALKRVAAFATGLATRSTANASFVLRAAMADLRVGDHTSASRLAKRALQLGLHGEERARALWVQGVADHLRGKLASARDSIARLIAERPVPQILESAERYLPVILEDMGDLDGALEQYISIGYVVDVGYFVDVLMTPEQLAHFIDTHPMSARRDQLLYALGVRYLRDRRWNEARQALLKVRTTGRSVDDEYNHADRYYYYGNNDGKKTETAKQLPPDPAIAGIRPQWIDQDLGTADDLERLEREVERADGDEAKAEAMYQMASYQYQGNLLFYNPAAWSGMRHYVLSDLDNSGLFRQPGEAQLLLRYMKSHDSASRSLDVFLEVVRLYPRTSAAKDALYTAAVCHERLSQYNNYWRDLYSRGGHAGERMVSYKEVKAAYPDYQLPRGTFGWEPATRTVNGGPGWQVPPKPPKRVPRLQRYLLRLASLGLTVQSQIERAAMQCITLFTYLFWLQLRLLLIVITAWLWYETLKAKKRLVAELSEAACWPRALIGPAEESTRAPAFVRDYLNFLDHAVRDEWRATSQRWARDARWFLLRTRTGSAVVLNVMLYGSGLVFLLMLFNLRV